MGKNFRAGRLGGEIQKIVSHLLQFEIKDPRLSSGFVGITAVDVTQDGSYAVIYFTSMGTDGSSMPTDEEKKELIAAFEDCKGFIRREISRNIKMHHTPELAFKYDTSMEYGMHMEEVLANLK